MVLVGRMILAMGVGLFAPPFGVGYYAACAIGRVDPADGIRTIWGYLPALLMGLIVVAIFPCSFDRVPVSAYVMGGGR
jgi:TRAP-type C4-dicarboxylate transport system permease large subunit